MQPSEAIRSKLQQATETGRAKVQMFETEAQKLVQKLAQKGRDAQAEGLRRLETFKPVLAEGVAPVVERVKTTVDVRGRVSALRDGFQGAIGGGVERVLGGFGIASRAELDKLQKRFESLSSRISELAKSQKKSVKESRAHAEESGKKARKVK